MKETGENDTIGHISIPREMELEILARLPVNSLMQFKRVCKLWKSTIENDPSLIDLHLNQSNTQPGLCRILMSFTGKKNRDMYFESLSGENKRYMYSASLQGGPATHDLTLPGCASTSNRYNDKICRCSVSESLNGLVCYYNESDVHICNPSMRQVKTLPKSQNYSYLYQKTYYWDLYREIYSTFSFGFDPSTKKYKVLHLFKTSTPEQSRALACEIFTLQTDSRTREVFTLDTDSWRSITGVLPKLPYPFRSQGLCVNGAIHWMVKNEQGKEDLVAFYVGSEQFGVIILPEGISSRSDLTKVRGCLALLDYINRELIEMFVLDDYENQLWIKESIESPHYYQRVRNSISFGIAFTGEMLLTPNVLSYEYIMVPYHLKKKGVRLIRVSGLPDCLHPHSEKDWNFSITNHAESLSPLVTKTLLQFGDFVVYVNIWFS